MSSSVKFDFPLDEVLIRQTITMPNGVPFSQMTTEYTRQLFEETESLNEASQMWDDIIRLRLLESENKKLKEENEKLEGELESVKEQAEDSFQAIAEALCGEGDEADSIAGWGQDDKIVKRIKDLKEENKRLDETLEDTLASLNFHQERNEELKQEKWELKDDILYYRLYLYTADPGGSWSGPEKEDVDRFTDDPHKRKTLYEKIGYESDEESDDD